MTCTFKILSDQKSQKVNQYLFHHVNLLVQMVLSSLMLLKAFQRNVVKVAECWKSPKLLQEIAVQFLKKFQRRGGRLQESCTKIVGKSIDVNGKLLIGKNLKCGDAEPGINKNNTNPSVSVDQKISGFNSQSKS